MLEREEKMAMFNRSENSQCSQQEVVAEQNPEVKAYSLLNNLSQVC